MLGGVGAGEVEEEEEGGIMKAGGDRERWAGGPGREGRGGEEGYLRNGSGGSGSVGLRWIAQRSMGVGERLGQGELNGRKVGRVLRNAATSQGMHRPQSRMSAYCIQRS